MESSETANSSEASESSEAESSEISKSSETAKTEYSTSEESESVSKPQNENQDREKETDTATETESVQHSSKEQTDGENARAEAMSEFYSALESDMSAQEYYTEMLSYADSVNHTCTIILNLCFAILLCAGIAAGCLLAQSIWSKFR